MAVAVASAGFTNPMSPGMFYRFTANTDCWVKVTTTGGAAAVSTADNQLYIAGQVLRLQSPDGTGVTTNAFVHAIKDTGMPDGRASLGIEEGV